MNFSPEARKALLAYAWPGNVRELRNFMERMLILHGGADVELRLLPREFQRAAAPPDSENDSSATGSAAGLLAMRALPGDFKAARSAFEAYFLAAKLKECNGNIARLAEVTGLERSYLYRKLKARNIHGA